MSRNALVEITTINQALSLDVRPFDSVLMVTPNVNIASSSNLPIAVTSANELLTLYPVDITAISPEYLIARDFFLAEPSPSILYVYGESGSTYNDILTGLDTRWSKQWFITLPLDATSTTLQSVFQFINGVSNEYVVAFQSNQNITVADNITNVATYPSAKGYYVAADVEEKQAANLAGSRSGFFPGIVPWAAVELKGMLGSTYTMTERLELVGATETSSTGINICTVEENIPVIYYGKAMDGRTWFDYTLAQIAIDEYMRVGIFQYIVQKNTLGDKIPANAIGRSMITAEGMRILREFVSRDILYGQDDFDEDGNPMLNVEVVSMASRTIEIQYSCIFKGAIIKAKININLTSIDGN